MKTFLSICVAALVVAIVSTEDVLREDNEQIIEDEKLFKEFYFCMLDQGPCSSDNLKTLRQALPGYLSNNCAECSPKEKGIFDKHTKMTAEKYPEEYKALADKYGPKPE